MEEIDDGDKNGDFVGVLIIIHVITQNMGRTGFTAARHGSGSGTGVICDCTLLSHSISLLLTAHHEMLVSVKPPGLRKGSLDHSLSLYRPHCLSLSVSLTLLSAMC